MTNRRLVAALRKAHTTRKYAGVPIVRYRVTVEMARAFCIPLGPRRRNPRLASLIGLLAVASMVAAASIAGLDGLAPRELWGELLIQPFVPQALLILSWFLVPAALMNAVGVRTSGEHGQPLHFSSLPGGRLTVAYSIWLANTATALLLLMFLAASAIGDVDYGHPQTNPADEAALWLIHWSVILEIGGLVISGLVLILAVFADAIVTAVRAQRGKASPEDRTARIWFAGLTILVLLVFGFAIALLAPPDPMTRAIGGITFAVLIVATTAGLFLAGKRIHDETGATGLVNSQMSRKGTVIASIVLLLVLGYFIARSVNY